MEDPLPPAYKYWPYFVQDAYDERLCIMREGNNIPLDEPTPLAIRMAAIQAAEAEIELVRKHEAIKRAG